jgi:hypothetical protein
VLGDVLTWQDRIAETLKLMIQAGLKHQVSLVRRTYGSALEPILEVSEKLSQQSPKTGDRRQQDKEYNQTA